MITLIRLMRAFIPSLEEPNILLHVSNVYMPLLGLSLITSSTDVVVIFPVGCLLFALFFVKLSSANYEYRRSLSL